MSGAGGINGAVIIVHAVEGRLTLKVERAVNSPMLEVTDSAGNTFCIAADDYPRASPEEMAQFFAAKATSIREEAARLN